MIKRVVSCLLLFACVNVCRASDKCINDCLNQYDEDVLACSVEYLNDLMKCCPSCLECFTKSTDQYNQCLADAQAKATGCIRDCSDFVIPTQIPDNEEECLRLCEDNCSHAIAECQAQWYEDYMMCDEIIDTNIREKCRNWAKQDCDKCFSDANKEYRECSIGCQ